MDESYQRATPSGGELPSNGQSAWLRRAPDKLGGFACSPMKLKTRAVVCVVSLNHLVTNPTFKLFPQCIHQTIMAGSFAIRQSKTILARS